MRERPILFGAPMVKALLAGTKTQDRRIVKPQPVEFDVNRGGSAPILALGWKGVWNGYNFGARKDSLEEFASRCPFGVPGDRLYAKETWGSPDAGNPCVVGDRPPRPGDRLVYRADAADAYQWDAGSSSRGSFGWRSGCVMPRWASRITLEITEVRVQRLAELSEEDAKAEGVTAELLAEMLRPLAARANPRPLHWIGSTADDNGEDYCRPCCAKRVAKLPKKAEATVDGGYGSEEDCPRFCADCMALLDFTLTDHGAASELEHYAEHGIDRDPVSAFCALAMVENGSCGDKLGRVGYRFLWDSPHGKRPGARWADSPWCWAISFRRVVLDGASR